MRPAEPTPVNSCWETRGAVGCEGCVQPHIPKSAIGSYWLAVVQQVQVQDAARCSALHGLVSYWRGKGGGGNSQSTERRPGHHKTSDGPRTTGDRR